MKKFNLNKMANEIIERYIEDREEFDIEKEEAIKMLKKAVLEENMDLNNDTTSYDLEELMLDEYENEYNKLQKIIHSKVTNIDLNEERRDR